VLINAIFPTITRTADTFGSASSEADTRIRTDFRIVNTFANNTAVKVWLKNVGSARLHSNEVDGIEVFLGAVGDFDRVSRNDRTISIEDNTNNYWDPGETLTIMVNSIDLSSAEDVYVAVVLPNGVRRDLEFSKNA
jgi:flagellar protein FlaG